MRRPAEGVWEMTWISEWWARGGFELNELLNWRKNWRRRGRRGSTECVTQLSVGVVFNWINLLWNVQVLPGMMPCVRWRRRRRGIGGVGWGWGGLWGSNVIKQDLKRQIPPQGLSASFPVTLSPLYYFVWIHSTTHASNFKNIRHIRIAYGPKSVWNIQLQKRPSSGSKIKCNHISWPDATTFNKAFSWI